MFRHHRFTRFCTMFLVLALLSNSVLPVAHAQSTTPLYLPIVANGNALPQTDLLFRTQIQIQTSAQWRDLQRMEVVILEQGADWALVLVDDLQLEDLARLRYNPDVTNALATMAAHDSTLHATVANLLQQANALGKQIQAAEVQGSDATATAARVELRAQLQQLEASQLEAISQAASVDSDNDGLTNDQEIWWCTNPNNRDTDDDDSTDGEEINNVKAWVQNRQASPPGQTPWPDWPFNPLTCPDKDRDSIPNSAESRELGLNQDRESTDLDKFDDGQEVFGVTNCPGGNASCTYGDLPRSSDTGYVGSTMPGWVKAPGNHPLVAAYPVPEIDVVASSLKVETVTEVTTDHHIASGTQKSYSTAKTEGTSTSVANTKNWNDWEEVSVTSPIVTTEVSASATDEIGVLTGIVIGTALSYLVTCADSEIRGEKSSCRIIGEKVAEGTKSVFNTMVETQRQCINNAYEEDSEWRRAVQLNMCTNYQTFPLFSVQAANAATLSCQSSPVIPSTVQSCIGPASGTLTLSSSFNRASTIDSKFQNRQGSQAGVAVSANTSTITASPLHAMSYPLVLPVSTSTSTKGHSQGGAVTTTSEKYEEHTVTNGESFSSEESWGNATAVDSAHAADFWFSFTVRNVGTEYARQIKNLVFNLYLGSDTNPICTYYFATGKCGVAGDAIVAENLMPHSQPLSFTSARIPLSLEQMKAIDLGATIRVVVQNFSYGNDQPFYERAATGNLFIAVEDGAEDGDENIENYLIPTWTANETVLQVLTRYFPYETDNTGAITAIWTPEYRTDNPAWCKDWRRPSDYPNKALWCKHTLSTADWWNVYTNGLGNGSEGFQNTQAVPGSVALFRFNKDTDLDGFSDRSETQLGTDINDAASFPRPEVLAGVHNVHSGNRVTSTLSLLNSGVYDAYGVEAVMIAPDDSVSITNNTVGGSGRVRALKQVIVGSSLKLQTPLPATWTQDNHATPGVGGYYTRAQDRTYTFTVTDCPAGGCAVGSGTWKLDWVDGQGGNGRLDFGANYKSPTFLPVGTLGLTLALYSGNVANGESFTVNARTPRDTFQYTINRQPYTEPLVIVSYNDPQGNHRFVLPSVAMSLTQPTDNLQQYAGSMLDDVGVEIVTSQPFTVGVNSATLLVNNPSDKTLQNAHLFLEVINISGTVVAETPVTVTLPPGPTATQITFDTSDFNPAYLPADDYIVMAFLTDYQGNILDTAGRPLSSFQVDPLPQLATDGNPLIWNFGVATQGTLMKYTLPIANTGFGRLYTYLPPVAGIKLDQPKTKSIGAADVATYELIFSTAVTAIGRYEQVVTIATNALLSNTLTLQITGQVNPLPETTALSLQKNELALPQQTAQGNTDIFAHNGSNLSRSVANNWLEMIRNGGFETGNLQEWNVGNGEWTIGVDGPRSGGRSVWKQRTDRSANHAWIYQENNVGQWQSYINDGRAQAKVGIWQWNQAGDSRDNGRIKVFYFQGNNTLAAFDSGYVNSQSGYGLLQDTRVIPAGTDRIRLEFWTKREANDYNDVAADDAFMQVLLSEPPTPTPTPTLTPTPTMTPTPTPVATVRYIRVPVATYTSFLLDFTAGSGGTVALDLGDDGTIDWRASLDAPRQLTSNLNDALNSYLAGKSGDVDVPLRFYLAPLHPITLNDYQATIAPTTDLVADSITVSGGTINAGDTVTVNATLRSSNGNSGPVTAAFFATATGWGDWYIGSAFVANVTSSGVPVSVQWNTTGFSGTVPVKVVINPYQRVAETNYNNNRKETSVIVPLPPVLPAAPTGLVATMAATNRINLTWTDASTNESGFKIERSLTGVNGWTQIATAGANVTTYASIGLACGKAYFYRVRSTNSNGDSAFSNVATTLTRLCTPALQPVTGITQTQLTLVWTDNNSNESGFKLERSLPGATPWSQIATVGANVTTYTNSGLTCGTPYYYRVRAYTGTNNSAYSTMQSAITTICTPAAPTLLAATAISATQINLSWTDASSNESGFKLERSPDGVNGWSLLTTVGANVTSHNDSNLACATAYHYRVRATNAGGDSPNSNVANATTPTCLPDLIFADGFESSNLLAWSARAIGGGDLRSSATAALVGSQGMEAVINDNSAMYVTDQRPEAEPRYRARFYFDPNSIAMTSGNAHFIFYGYQGTNTVVSRVEFRRLNSSYQLRAAALNDPPTTGAATWRTTSYVTISDAPHFLELDWQAATAPGANNGMLNFWIDGVQRPSLINLDNDSRRIDIARLGPIGGLDTGTRGSYYFDAFESRRRSYIGPVAGSALAAEVMSMGETATGLEATVLNTVTLQTDATTTITATVAKLGVAITFPASTTRAPITAHLLVTDTLTQPDGYALVGEMMTMQTNAPITEPLTVTIAYGAAAADVLMTTPTLHQWNATIGQWEAIPALVDSGMQSITASIQVPAIFALWQTEMEALPAESSEQNAVPAEIVAPAEFSIYLPLVQE